MSYPRSSLADFGMMGWSEGRRACVRRDCFLTSTEFRSTRIELVIVLKTLSLSEVKIKLSALIDEIRDRDEEVTITRNGRPVAVLVSADEFESWKETLSIRADAPLSEEIARGLAELKAGRAELYTLDELIA